MPDWGPRIVAQNLGEYAGLGGTIGGFLSRVRSVIEQELGDVEPRTWVLVAGVLFVLWLFFRRR